MSRSEQLRLRLVAVLLTIRILDLRSATLKRLTTLFDIVCPDGLSSICVEQLISEFTSIGDIIFEKHQTTLSTAAVGGLRISIIRDLWNKCSKLLLQYRSETTEDRNTGESQMDKNRPYPDILISNFNDLVSEL